MTENGETAVALAQARQSVLAIEREPSIVLEEARKAAVVLKDVLDKKPNKVMMNDQQYLEFEDWQTLGRFYGISAKEDGDPEYVELGRVSGFKASAVATTVDGRHVSRATAYCLSDEEKWGERPKYQWVYVCKDGSTSVDDPGRDQIIWEPNPNKPGGKRPKKQRISAGVEAVPLFQLASMAQTRACAKALRNVLAWVVVLAGYRPTPAEELEGPQTPAVKVHDEDVIEGEAREIPEDEPAPPEPSSAPRKPAAANGVPPVSTQPPRNAERVTTGTGDPASHQQRAYIERLLSDVGLEWTDLREIEELRTLPAWPDLTIGSVPLAVDWLLKQKRAITNAK